MNNDDCYQMIELQRSLKEDFEKCLLTLKLQRRVGEAQTLARQVHRDANTTACINDNALLAEMIGLLSTEASKYIIT